MLRRGPCLSLDRFGGGLPARAGDSGDSEGRRRMLRALRQAAAGELTARQLQCVRLYYSKGMTMREAASSLGVSTSTVSRHLKKARARLRRVLEYGGFPGGSVW
jgi:RNA polymerase sigma factor (sigma-70 family)